MDIPDITGYTLGEAKRLLEAAGIRLASVTVTAPPREKCSSYDDNCRVIRCTTVDVGCVELLVCKDMNT